MCLSGMCWQVFQIAIAHAPFPLKASSFCPFVSELHVQQHSCHGCGATVQRMQALKLPPRHMNDVTLSHKAHGFRSMRQVSAFQLMIPDYVMRTATPWCARGNKFAQPGPSQLAGERFRVVQDAATQTDDEMKDTKATQTPKQPQTKPVQAVATNEASEDETRWKDKWLVVE